MEKVFFDSLFFLFGIPIAYIAVAIICMINQKVRENESADDKGGQA